MLTLGPISLFPCLLALATNKRTWRLVNLYKQTEPLNVHFPVWLGRAVSLCRAAGPWNVTSLCGKSQEQVLPVELAGTELLPAQTPVA